MAEYKKEINCCYKFSDKDYLKYDYNKEETLDDILDNFDKLTIKTDYSNSNNRPKCANEIKNDNLNMWTNLEPYSNTFRKRGICWFPTYIQIGKDEDFADYLVLRDISKDLHKAQYYKISGEYAFSLYYDGYTYMKECFSGYNDYIPCYVTPCSAKDILDNNSMCKLEDTALLLKEIFEDVKKEDPSAIKQSVWFENGYYYHSEHYMKNKYIHFSF